MTCAQQLIEESLRYDAIYGVRSALHLRATKGLGGPCPSRLPKQRPHITCQLQTCMATWVTATTNTASRPSKSRFRKRPWGSPHSVSITHPRCAPATSPLVGPADRNGNRRRRRRQALLDWEGFGEPSSTRRSGPGVRWASPSNIVTILRLLRGHVVNHAVAGRGREKRRCGGMP
jgi:hypothetical protein